MDVNEYFTQRITNTKLSEAKMLLAAAMSLITGKMSLKRFKKEHPQVLFDNLQARIKLVKKCLRVNRKPTKEELASL